MSDKNYNVTLTERELLIAVFALSSTADRMTLRYHNNAERIALARYGELAEKLDGLLSVVVEEAPIADAPKVEGAKCVAHFTIKPGVDLCPSFDPTTVKRNPFYFGNSITNKEPITQPCALCPMGISDGKCGHGAGW